VIALAKSGPRPRASASTSADFTRRSADTAIARLIAITRVLIGELRRMNRLGIDSAGARPSRRERSAAVIAELDRRHRHPNRCC